MYSLKMLRSPRRSFFRIEDLLTTSDPQLWANVPSRKVFFTDMLVTHQLAYRFLTAFTIDLVDKLSGGFFGTFFVVFQL